jgi:hypothetical protein
VEAKHRDAPLVDDARIDIAVAVVVRELLAAPREADRRAVEAPVIILELLPVAAGTRIALNASHESVRGLREAPPNLDVIPTWEIQLLVVEPPRHVDVPAADAILVMRDMVHHRRNESGDVGPGRVGEILAHDAAGVRQSLGKAG